MAHQLLRLVLRYYCCRCNPLYAVTAQQRWMIRPIYIAKCIMTMWRFAGGGIAGGGAASSPLHPSTCFYFLISFPCYLLSFVFIHMYSHLFFFWSSLSAVSWRFSLRSSLFVFFLILICVFFDLSILFFWSLFVFFDPLANVRYQNLVAISTQPSWFHRSCSWGARRSIERSADAPAAIIGAVFCRFCSQQVTMTMVFFRGQQVSISHVISCAHVFPDGFEPPDEATTPWVSIDTEGSGCGSWWHNIMFFSFTVA